MYQNPILYSLLRAVLPFFLFIWLRIYFDFLSNMMINNHRSGIVHIRYFKLCFKNNLYLHQTHFKLLKYYEEYSYSKAFHQQKINCIWSISVISCSVFISHCLFNQNKPISCLQQFQRDQNISLRSTLWSHHCSFSWIYHHNQILILWLGRT